MVNGEKVKVAFFRNGSGREYVRDWIKSLPDKGKKAIGVDIRHIQNCWPIGKPTVDSIGDGIWEVRTELEKGWARILFCFHANEMILLHGFMKKSNKTPRKDIDTAKNRMSKL